MTVSTTGDVVTSISRDCDTKDGSQNCALTTPKYDQALTSFLKHRALGGKVLQSGVRDYLRRLIKRLDELVTCTSTACRARVERAVSSEPTLGME